MAPSIHRDHHAEFRFKLANSPNILLNVVSCSLT